MPGENAVHGSHFESKGIVSAPPNTGVSIPLQDVSRLLGPEPHESLPQQEALSSGDAVFLVQNPPQSTNLAVDENEMEIVFSETAEQLKADRVLDGDNQLQEFDESRLQASLGRLISDSDDDAIYRLQDIATFRTRHYDSAGKAVSDLRKELDKDNSLSLEQKEKLEELQKEFQALSENFLTREAPAIGEDKNDLQTLKKIVGGRTGIKWGWFRCLFSRNARRARSIQRRARGGETFDQIYTAKKLQKIHPKAALALYLRGRLKEIGLGEATGTSTAALAKSMAKEYRALTERSEAWRKHSHVHKLSIKVPRAKDGGVDEKPLFMESKQTPASDLPLLRSSFQDGVRGVSCLNTREKNHVTNLWKTEYRPVEGSMAKVSFAGFRHGVIDAYGIKGDVNARKQAGINKATELVRAAVSEMPNAVTKNADGQWTIPMVSVSLQTAGSMGDGEMIESQDAAWSALQEQGVRMEGPAPDGSEGPWILKPDCSRFFIGVNPLALGGGVKSMVKNTRLGHWESQFGKQNDASLTRLIDQARAAYAKIINDLPMNDDKYLKAKLVLELIDQISAMQMDRSYQKLDDDPYKLATRVLLLANLIGSVPCFNCKSGKDRTGVVDVETKALVQSINENIARHGIHSDMKLVPDYGHTRSEEQKAAFQELHLHGGGMQVSFANTGLMGNKTNIGNYLRENLDDHTVEMIAGFARHADGNK